MPEEPYIIGVRNASVVMEKEEVEHLI